MTSARASHEVRIRTMTAADLPGVLALADRLIGADYYAAAELADLWARSQLAGEVCSFVAEREASGDLVGFRFTLPPGRWQSGRGHGLSPHRWGAPLAACGYFQTAFVDPSAQRQGVGTRMARAALACLRRLGAQGAVTHSWKESPDNSSVRYLRRLGFEEIAEFPGYWRDVDYTCVRDGKPCGCTAVEMFLRLAHVATEDRP